MNQPINEPHRIVIQKSAEEWIVRDTVKGDEIRIGSAPNIRLASDLAADFVTAYDQQRRPENVNAADNSDQR